MATLCDFTVIQGDEDQLIGDGAILWVKNFDTEARLENAPAFLMLMVKGLTYATDGVDVVINNNTVGKIFPFRWQTGDLRDAAASHWHTEIINVGSNILREKNNEIRIEAINFPEATGSNQFDDFYVRDVICFFKQSS